MNINRPQLLDSYDLRARLFPALLVIVPIPVCVICLSRTYTIATTILSILVGSGLTFALSRIARNAGKRLEGPLFAKWGGPPTTQLLRYSNPTIDAVTKDRYHRALSAGIGRAMPTAAEEANDPAEADKVYSAAVVWLIGQTRDIKRFPLIFKENVSYGFHRNTFGMRPAGILVAVVTFASVILLAFTVDRSGSVATRPDTTRLTVENGLALAVAGIMLLVWLIFFSEAAVKSAAFAYGIRLLESCDQLVSDKGKTKKSTSIRRKG